MKSPELDDLSEPKSRTATAVLEAIEKEAYDLQKIVRIHEIRY